MATADVTICNRALTKIGDDVILSLDDNVKRARLCKLFFADLRDALLRAHPWNFAITRAELAKISSNPLYDYSSQFQLPNDCLRVIEPDLDNASYRIEGKYILCNDSSLKIKYVAQVTDANKFDAHFKEALICRLAQELAIPIADDYSLEQRMKREYMMALAEARNSNAIENYADSLQVNDWLDARQVYKRHDWDGTV